MVEAELFTPVFAEEDGGSEGGQAEEPTAMEEETPGDAQPAEEGSSDASEGGEEAPQV